MSPRPLNARLSLRPERDGKRALIRGKFHISPSANEKPDCALNWRTLRARARPHRDTRKAPVFRVRGRTTNPGVGNRAHLSKQPPVIAKGARAQLPLTITRSSSLDQRVLYTAGSRMLVTRVKRTEYAAVNRVAIKNSATAKELVVVNRAVSRNISFE